MPEEPKDNWNAATFDGLRLRQLQEFYALPFREKLDRIEQMNEVAAHFAANATPASPSPATPDGPQPQ